MQRTFTLEVDILKRLKGMSDETMIPQSRIVERAIEKELATMQKKLDKEGD